MSIEDAITDLQSKVGTETHVGPWLTVTQERIDQFAEATLDRQWIHVDPERAKAESPYGTTVAHGYLTLSLIPHLTGSVDPDKPRFPGVKMGVNYGLNKVRFPNPVPVGAKIRARTRLLGFEKAKGGLQIINQVTIEIEGQEKPGCVAETVSLLYF
jgi:acyl dehydratase